MTTQNDFVSGISIRIKMILAYSLLFVLVIIGSSVFIWFSVRDTIQKDIEDQLVNSAESIRNMIASTAGSSIRSNLRAIAKTCDKMVQTLYGKYLDGELTEREAKTRANSLLLGMEIGETGYVYCLSSDGVVKVHPKKSLIGVDLTRYDFVKKQIENKTGYMEYKWQNPGDERPMAKAVYMTWFKPWDWIISASSYREEFHDLIRVEEFQEEILSLKIGESGYVYVMDSEGNLIIHPTMQGENIYDYKDEKGKRYVQEMARMKNGKISYTWKNPGEEKSREKLVIFRYIPEFDWIVASSAYYDEFFAPLVNIRNIIFISGFIALILMVSITLLLSARIVNPLKRLTEVAQSLSSFDLTRDPGEAGREDEIGQVLESMGKMIVNLRSIVNRALDSAREVESSASRISDALIDQVSVASQHSASVTEISSTMEQFSASSGQIAENAQSVVDIAEKTLKSSETGTEVVKLIQKQMDEIYKDNRNNIEMILDLKKKSDEISKVMEIINNITDQTKLIAFNAALEASSAGESGKRFSVVAVEIRRLAENVDDSTGKIETTINEIQEAANHMVVVSEKRTKSIRDGLNSISKIVGQFDEILSYAEETTDASRQISLSTRQQKTATDQVVIALKDIEKGTRQSDRSIHDISEISKNLNTLANNLKNLMEKFKLPQKRDDVCFIDFKKKS